MTKAERKLLQEREAKLFLEKEQYIDWFGRDSNMARTAVGAWLAVYELLELLDTEVDHNLPDNKEAWDLMRVRQELEAELATQAKNK
jgi:hypothetical protein|tara:strand:+ start:3939 stop:4199 length:261 start_codon:yes stop_codon:yes gene_type:complete